MEHFTPISVLVGGLLIGLSAALLWLFNGRIAGISGIVGAVLTPHASEPAWRIAFVLGLIAAPVLYRIGGGALPTISLPSSLLAVLGGGFLVGFGTRLGSGCTSGHGVCGLARFSRRSICATALFMVTAIVANFIFHHVMGL